jgi:hypothetical protein
MPVTQNCTPGIGRFTRHLGLAFRAQRQPFIGRSVLHTEYRAVNYQKWYSTRAIVVFALAPPL